jgi:hypothetical protein
MEIGRKLVTVSKRNPESLPIHPLSYVLDYSRVFLKGSGGARIFFLGGPLKISNI